MEAQSLSCASDENGASRAAAETTTARLLRFVQRGSGRARGSGDIRMFGSHTVGARCRRRTALPSRTSATVTSGRPPRLGVVPQLVHLSSDASAGACHPLPARATALGGCWVAWTRRQQALSDNSSSGDAAVFAGRLVAPARRESRRGAWLYRLLGSSSATTSTTARCASRSLDAGTSLRAWGSACFWREGARGGVPIGLSWSPANSRSGSSLLGAGPAG